MSIHVFGIRHHGPGCARSLRTALEQLEPDVILVEGPPDAEEVLPLLTDEAMKPPVSLLIYAPEKPKLAVYYPFTHFSPEWQALQYALTKNVPARFMDLPQAIHFARAEPELVTAGEAAPEADPTKEAADTPQDQPASLEERAHTDPLALLAEAAGYTDHELWWERQIEQRQDMENLFAGILEAMSALRSDPTPKDEEEALREAHMRQTIRVAQKEGYQRIAVVCGAWHAPVLQNPGPAKADTALLNKLKRVKVAATWIPWTNARLSYRSGYGAGVTSPGWYEHLWTTREQVSTRWITKAARLLREQDLDASSASVIEAARLTDALAALRDLSMPGLAEHHEAIETVLCHGNPEPMALIRTKLEIGDRLGEVPPATPALPLQRDLEAQQRRLRLKASTEIVTLDLDLRNETDRGRSQLLHRLRLLNIEWGEQQRVRGKSGTFHEIWQIQWRVEFAIALVEANIWGNTVESAATAFVIQQAEQSEELPQLSKLLDQAILAELSNALDPVLSILQQRAAVSSDVRHLMDALPALARVVRYGNVRQTRAEALLPVIDGLFERIVIGLPGACSALDDDAAQEMLASIERAQDSIALLDRSEQRTEWLETLRKLLANESIHGLIRGRSCRLLLEQNVMDEEELQRQTGLALSSAVPATQAASWVEGVLRGSALGILHQDNLWRALDRWLVALTGETFEALLPILRRAFANFQAPERRAMGDKVRTLYSTTASGTTRPGMAREIDTEQAAQVLPLLAQILGVNTDGR